MTSSMPSAMMTMKRVLQHEVGQVDRLEQNAAGMNWKNTMMATSAISMPYSRILRADVVDATEPRASSVAWVVRTSVIHSPLSA